MQPQISTFNLITWLIISTLVCLHFYNKEFNQANNTNKSLLKLMTTLTNIPAGNIMITKISCQHNNCSIQGHFNYKKTKILLENTLNLECEFKNQKFICQNQL